MTLARDERIFLYVLLGNLIVSVVYLLVGVLILTPAKEAATKEDGTEPLYDNRRTYVIRFVEMLLCPVIVPLFFFMGHLCYLFIFWKEANLEDVIFSKDRVKTNLRADEEVERDIIPLEEAILVNEKKDLRMVMMNVMRKDISNSLASITLALDSEDSETSHYAAAVLSDELNRFRIRVQKLWRQIGEEGPDETECEEVLLSYMDNILKQRIFSSHEQRKFVETMRETAQSLYDKDRDRITLKQYEMVCLRLLEMKEYEASDVWCARMAEQYPDELASYTCRLKLYFACQDRDAFFDTLEALKRSDVVIDTETLELVRVFSVRRQ